MSRNKHNMGEKTTATKAERNHTKAVDRAIGAQDQADRSGTRRDAKTAKAANDRTEGTFGVLHKANSRFGRRA